MIALAMADDLRDIRNAIAGRIVCLESIIQLLVKHDGIVPVAMAFSHLRPLNTMLRVVFSEAGSTSKETCLDYLDSYLADLSGKVGDDFLYHP